jgi:hypothetical protein
MFPLAILLTRTCWLSRFSRNKLALGATISQRKGLLRAGGHKAARTVTGLSISVVEGPRRPGDSPRLVADATRARTKLGWQVRYGDLTKIIATTWNWMLKHQPKFSGGGSLRARKCRIGFSLSPSDCSIRI